MLSPAPTQSPWMTAAIVSRRSARPPRIQPTTGMKLSAAGAEVAGQPGHRVARVEVAGEHAEQEVGHVGPLADLHRLGGRGPGPGPRRAPSRSRRAARRRRCPAPSGLMPQLEDFGAVGQPVAIGVHVALVGQDFVLFDSVRPSPSVSLTSGTGMIGGAPPPSGGSLRGSATSGLVPRAISAPSLDPVAVGVELGG